MHLDAPFGQFGRDQIGGAVLFKTQLGMGVDIAAHARNGVGFADDVIKELHAFSLARQRPFCRAMSNQPCGQRRPAISSKPSKMSDSTNSNCTDMLGAIFQPAPPAM